MAHTDTGTPDALGDVGGREETDGPWGPPPPTGPRVTVKPGAVTVVTVGVTPAVVVTVAVPTTATFLPSYLPCRRPRCPTPLLRTSGPRRGEPSEVRDSWTNT